MQDISWGLNQAHANCPLCGEQLTMFNKGKNRNFFEHRNVLVCQECETIAIVQAVCAANRIPFFTPAE